MMRTRLVKRVVRARRKAKTKPTAAPPRLTTNKEAGGGVGCQHDPWLGPFPGQQDCCLGGVEKDAHHAPQGSGVQESPSFSGSQGPVSPWRREGRNEAPQQHPLSRCSGGGAQQPKGGSLQRPPSRGRY